MNNEKKKIRFKNVDFLRIIGAFTIVYCHSIRCPLIKSYQDMSDLLKDMVYTSAYSYMWVTFFFIMSGFFFFHYSDFSTRFIDYFKKKIIRFLPVIVFAVVLYWVLSLFTPIVYRKYVNMFVVFLLNSMGLAGLDGGNIGTTWYVAAFFWVSCLYFYLTKIYDKKYINLLMGITPFFAYIFLLHAPGRINTVYFHFIPKGILFAMGGMSLGYWVNEIYNLNKDNLKKQLSKLEYFLYGCLEGYLLYYIVRNTVFHRLGFMNFMPLIFVFLGLFYLFLIKRGFVSRLLENDFSVILGRYSYSIFVVHIIIVDLMAKIIWKPHMLFTINHIHLNMIMTIMLSSLLGIIAYHLVEKPAEKYLKSKWTASNDLKNIMIEGGGKNCFANNKNV